MPRDITGELRTLKAQVRDMTDRLNAITARVARLNASHADSAASMAQTLVVVSLDERPLTARAIALIDRDRCRGCGLCIDICPEHAITMSVDVAVDAAQCTGCGICVAGCPAQAILLSSTVQRMTTQMV